MKNIVYHASNLVQVIEVSFLSIVTSIPKLFLEDGKNVKVCRQDRNTPKFYVRTSFKAFVTQAVLRLLSFLCLFF